MPRVYVGRLSYHVREKDIQRFFSGYGKLLEIDLKNGYGFVEFEDNRDADDAVYELNGKELSGYSSRSRSGRDKYGPPVRTEYRLIVENLSSRCSWQDLKDFMRQAGEVTYADAHKERTNEGVIEFRSYSDMRRALDKLDGTDINGRKIRLVEDKPRRRRSYSGSRSRYVLLTHFIILGLLTNESLSRSRSGRKSHSKSPVNKSRSNTRKSRSRSRTRKSLSRSVSHKSRSRSARKSRSKSRSKAKSDRDSRSRSKEKSVNKKSRSRSVSPVENGNGERAKSASRSPSPQDERHPSASPAERSASRSPSRSKSRSRSRSASQD
uniref:RRM domain-containing protein n=1 Tax=Denticeps clupeoides TaxID=299321 RepID=A0AAY4EK57_9TELE